MNTVDRLKLLAHIVRWRLTWSRHDSAYKPPNLASAKFISAHEAAARIPDHAAVLSCGMAGNARCSTFFWAIRERFEREAAPRGLTWMNVGAQGGRGKVPGTVEELALPGLLSRYTTGHMETAKALLRLAEDGQLALYTLPQGQMSLLLAAQGRGEETLRTVTGLNTFLDPRVGRGAAVSPGAENEFIEADGDHLIYRMPKVDICLFNAPFADAEGNIYFKHAATITENVQGAQAARRNGGLVMAVVSAVVPKDPAAISMPANEVDSIVVNPTNEQTGSVQQRRYWPMFTVGSKVPERDAVERLKFVNHVLKITPVRGPVENALARLAARLFVRVVPKGGIVNIGVGFPEEVCRLVIEQGLGSNYTFTTETGVYGGLPAPGIFFGAAINPTRMEPSSWMFELYRDRLDVAVLGFLQVDSQGNVNVSKRGPRMLDYVGPGGFPDIAAGAKTLIFVGSWMAHARFSLREGRLTIEQPGTPKFVAHVDEITLSGKEALRLGKQVYYVTNIGVFQLATSGLTLIEVMPGIDVQRDILQLVPGQIQLPADGQVPITDPAVLTGRDFTMA